MIAPGFAGLEEQLWLWLFAMIRPGAALFAAPVTGAKLVPVQLRLIVSLAIGIAAIGGGQIKMPADGLMSISGFVLILGELLIGLAIGFAVQIGYAAAFVAGETISNAMGLGFASMSDPQTGQSTPVIGQFLSIIATLILLAMDGHLILASTIVRSYEFLPPGSGLMSADAAFRLANFGGSLFVAGLAIAFPMGSALILVQIIMGLLARSAPSMNLFAVGLPATLTLGLVMLAMASPLMIDGIAQSLSQSLQFSDDLARGG
ncbi:MAG: flagellar biosynthetic protein FliR [Parasphingorhabdus sp.]|uniref:flagellar biosynthetic protein FliR n=1 Tax=Parasphingorhabdus sp. TaxID=2709688 RepID=UPI003001CC2B